MSRDLRSRVGALELRVTAADGETAIVARDALEPVVRAALESADRRIGSEVVVLHKLDLRLRARRSGAAMPDWSGALTRAVHEAVWDAVCHARGGRAATDEVRVSGDTAWFASVGVRVAAAALARPGPDAWPYQNRVGPEAWRDLAALPASDLADALAWLARRANKTHSSVSSEAAFTQLVEWLSAITSARRSELWLGRNEVGSGTRRTGGPKVRAFVQRFAEVRRLMDTGTRDAIDALLLADGEAQRLARLAILFASWPPARGIQVPSGSRSEPGLDADRLDTGAVCAMVVASVCARELDALRGLIVQTRERRSVLWAVARAVVDARASRTDPCVLLFAEEPAAAHPSELPWGQIDVEPLHHATLRRMDPHEVSVWPAGENVYAICERGVVDVIERSPDENPMERIAQRLHCWLGREVALTFHERPPPGELDRVLEVDHRAWPRRFRPGLLSFCSLLAWQIGQQGLELSSLRSLRGTIEWSPGRAVVTVKRPLSPRVQALLPIELRLGPARCEVRGT